MASLSLLIPGIGLLLVVFIYPLVSFLSGSVLDSGPTLRNYVRIVQSRGYLIVFWNTLRISLEVTLTCLAIGYPLALRIATLRPRPATLLLAAVIVPVWISILVRNYAWMVILGRQGLLSQALQAVGVIDAPRSFLFNEVSVLIGMTHVLLPFMVLPVVATIRGIDRSLVRAAENLGAGPSQVFRRVILPLSLPGVSAGVVLVFITALGFFVTPTIMGGRNQMMVAMLIDQQITEQLAWGFGGALAMVLLAVTLGIFAIYRRQLGLDRLVRGHL